MNQPSTQTALFSEDIHDALKDVIRTLGGTKSVGAQLRPELTSDAAGAWLKDCLNPERRERLDPEQVLWLLRKGKEAGCHSAMHFICDEAGYGRPVPLDPKDEAAELNRQLLRGMRELRAGLDRLERLQGVKAVA